jgi:hypothetical protein
MKFTGSSDIVALHPRRIIDPLRGVQIELRFRGAPAALLTYEAVYVANGYRTDIDPAPDGGYGRLSVWLGADATQPPEIPLVDQWELEGNDVDISVFNAQALRSVTGAMTPAGRAQFRSDVESIFRGELDPDDFLAAFSGAQRTVVDQLIESIGLGIETDPESRYVLRRSTIIAGNSTIKPSLENVGLLISTADLIATHPVPATIKFDLPEGYWRKRTPRAKQTALDKWTVTQEWWWQLELYPLDREVL